MARRRRVPPKWQKSEHAAGEIYGRCVPASGSCKALGKSDIIGEGAYAGWRGENKYTEKGSYSLSLEELNKIAREAFQAQSTDWFFRIDYDGKVYVVIEESMFRSFME